MKLNTLRRHLRESTKNLGRNGWMTFASVSAVTVTLLLVGVFLVIMMNLNSMATSLEKDVRISVHMELTSTEEEHKALQAEIEKVAGVDEVVFSSKDQELYKMIDSFGEDGKVFALYEQSNPLHDVFVVKTENPQDIMKVAEAVEKMEHVHSVNYGKGKVEKIFSTVGVSRNIGIGLIIGLLFTAMFLISNTIKITIFARKREIEIMKLVGATNAFIRWPFFLEGLFLGILGSLLPIGIILGFYNFLYDLIQPQLAGTFLKLLPFNPFAFQVTALLLLVGAFIGVWGSLMSVRKFLKV
ncbi:permease-like cell division protein FtsX [Bacillus sinesaloumensis]|uniref:permease-like cell division protein FtsX n=1 Tax=Litchfieldia sinesaloumensis TaxID=1926280 RepID=UPI0009888572|nr:permease-like cell division protein FtsX [Bacillus sinesaloumensis]